MKEKIKNILTKELFERLYIQDNLSLKDIAGQFHASIPYIGYLKEQYGIKTKPAIAYRIKHIGRNIVHPQPQISSILSRDKLIDIYIKEFKSLGDIGKIYKCSRQTIHNLLHTYGIKARDLSEARNAALKAKKLKYHSYSLNELFFSKWSKEMAYVLGLLLAHGRMVKTGTKRYTLQIVQSDIEMLNKIKQLLSSNHPITKKRRFLHGQIRIFYELDINRNKIVADLLNLGYKYNNKNMVKIIRKIPDIYLFDFLRGYFDGHGNIILGIKVGVAFFAPSKAFLSEIIKALNYLAIKKQAKCNINKSGKGFRLWFYKARDLFILFNILYKNPGSAYLNSRRDKFISVLQRKEPMLKDNKFLLLDPSLVNMISCYSNNNKQ